MSLHLLVLHTLHTRPALSQARNLLRPNNLSLYLADDVNNFIAFFE